MKKEEAISFFNNGCNCSQAVVMPYSEELNIDHEIVERISVAFGGGMSKQGKTCGCLSGALMVIGLKYGMDSAKEIEKRINSYNKGKDMIVKFKEVFGAIDCKDLIKLDLDNSKDMEKAQRENVFEKRCSKLVGETIEILEEYFK